MTQRLRPQKASRKNVNLLVLQLYSFLEPDLRSNLSTINKNPYLCVASGKLKTKDFCHYISQKAHIFKSQSCRSTCLKEQKNRDIGCFWPEFLATQQKMHDSGTCRPAKDQILNYNRDSHILNYNLRRILFLVYQNYF